MSNLIQLYQTQFGVQILPIFGLMQISYILQVSWTYYSRKVTTWTLSETLNVSCAIDTRKKIKKNRKRVNLAIIHSDRGRHMCKKNIEKLLQKW